MKSKEHQHGLPELLALISRGPEVFPHTVTDLGAVMASVFGGKGVKTDRAGNETGSVMMLFVVVGVVLIIGVGAAIYELVQSWAGIVLVFAIFGGVVIWLKRSSKKEKFPRGDDHQMYSQAELVLV